jgi:hypothetical protein
MEEWNMVREGLLYWVEEFARWVAEDRRWEELAGHVVVAQEALWACDVGMWQQGRQSALALQRAAIQAASPDVAAVFGEIASMFARWLESDSAAGLN